MHLKFTTLMMFEPTALVPTIPLQNLPPHTETVPVTHGPAPAPRRPVLQAHPCADGGGGLLLRLSDPSCGRTQCVCQFLPGRTAGWFLPCGFTKDAVNLGYKTSLGPYAQSL